MSVTAAYCGQCGLPVGGQPTGGPPADARDHGACLRAGALDPPRYCPQCGRRMIVKVTPDRWTARCAQHGAAAPGPGAPRPRDDLTR
ncbi:MAG TPA: hypothetical protein VHY58_13315 [Streptosporangiaceae bacterium]|nr:hypothetical protein [Streptosporangiaceae bacterium]